MPFTHLLWKCLLPGQTSLQEGRQSARLQPRAGECVLAFRIDCDDFRKAFDLQDKPVCDALFFLKRAAADPILLLVELKGSEFSKAVGQIESTLQVLKSRLTRHPAQYRAVVVTDRGVPTALKRRRQAFKSKHTITLETSHKGDLREFV